MKKAVLYIVCIGIIVGFQACTKENLEGCIRGLKLRVSYAFNSVEADAPAPQLQSTRAYVFNESNLLCAVGEASGTNLFSGQTIDFSLEPGKYKVIVWGSDNANFFHSYGEGTSTMSSLVGYTEGITIGKTALSDFYLFLKRQATEGAETQYFPSNNPCDDLYYGASGTRASKSSEYSIQEVTIPEDGMIEKNIELIRNTNVMDVSITGLSNLLNSSDFSNDADIYISVKGDNYLWNNSFGNNDTQTKYTPYNMQTNKDGLLSFNIKIQRIRMDMQSEKPLILYIKDKIQGKILLEMDILECLLKASDESGQYIYKNQEDLDRMYIHHIRLEFANNFTVKIFINGWEVQRIYPVH